jgi:hypothetical protein
MKGLFGFIRDTTILGALLLKRTCLRLCGRAEVVPASVGVRAQPTALQPRPDSASEATERPNAS